MNKKCEICVMDPKMAEYGKRNGSGVFLCYIHRNTNEEHEYLYNKCIICKKENKRSNALYKNNGYGAEYCEKHKEIGMDELIIRICLLCNKEAIYGNRNDEVNYCTKHKEKGMKKKEIHKTESYMKEYLDSKKIKYKFNKRLKSGTRPDFIIKIRDMKLIIENDENQHKQYQKELNRMKEIYKENGKKQTHIIRFNPNNFVSKKDKSISMSESLEIKHKMLKSRFDYLYEIIIKIKNDKKFEDEHPGLSYSYLFYDGWDDEWKIIDEEL